MKTDIFDEGIRERIVQAKERRDFLTHGFWRERSIEFVTAAGREKMIAELDADRVSFAKLDEDIEMSTLSLRSRLGHDEKKLAEHTDRMIERIKAGLPWDDDAPN